MTFFMIESSLKAKCVFKAKLKLPKTNSDMAFIFVGEKGIIWWIFKEETFPYSFNFHYTWISI